MKMSFWVKKSFNPIFINLILSFSFFVFAIGLFYSGFHNVDLSYNYAVVSYLFEQEGVQLVDHASDNNFYSNVDAYRMGLGQMRSSFSIVLVSSLVLGYSFSMLLRIKGMVR